MKPIDKEMQDLIRKIEAAGGRAGFSLEQPTWMKQAFIDTIHDCPDCQEEFRKRGVR